MTTPRAHAADAPDPLPSPATPAGGPARLIALDAFRGATMLAMVIVNNPGSWAHVYPPLRHAAWHGCTPTDLIFPFFLFIVGASMAFSMPRAVARLGRRGAWLRIMKRAALLVLIGLLLNGFPFFDLATLRVPGVLQRIGLCFALAGTLVLLTGVRTQVVLAAAMLLGVTAAMRVVPGGAGLTEGDNLARDIDLAVIGPAHLWRGSPTDPEGVLSTLPAAVTTLLGYWAGLWIAGAGRGAPRPRVGTMLAGLAAGGAALAAAGWLWSRGPGVAGVPLNKPLWTGSYVLFTAGLAALALAGLYALVEVARYRRLGVALQMCGVNALLLFVGSGVIARLLGVIKIDGAPLKTRIYESLAAALPGDDRLASLAFALINVGVWWLLLWWLWRRGWAWRV